MVTNTEYGIVPYHDYDPLKNAITAILECFYFDNNDTETRDTIVQVITPLVRHFEKKYDIGKYTVICNDTNNPPFVRDLNMLVLDLYAYDRLIKFQIGPE